MSDAVITVNNVSKTFKLPHEKQSSVKGLFLNLFRLNRTFETQQALKGISFEVKKGEFFGIVGRNGSGKSTLLKILAQIYQPTSGHVRVNGSLTPFIELGVGFNPELTGRENVFMNGALLGFSRKEMEEKYPTIVEFAELERFMDQKLKNYSSGMQVRLAFSIAVQSNSDILLFDEVLAVGDANFQAKCLNVFRELKEQGKTIVFVSHDMEMVRRFCTRVVLIDKSEIIFEGDTQKGIDKYLRIMTPKTGTKLPFGMHEVETKTGKVKILDVWGEGDSNKKTHEITGHKNYSIVVKFQAEDNVENPVPGVVLRNHDGIRVTASNTTWVRKKLGSMKAGEQKTVRFTFPQVLERGYYYVSANIVSEDLQDFYDWSNDAWEFLSENEYQTGGIINPKYNVEEL